MVLWNRRVVIRRGIELISLAGVSVVFGGCASSAPRVANAFLAEIPTPTPAVASVPAPTAPPLVAQTAPTPEPATQVPPTPTAIWAAAATPVPPTVTPTTAPTLGVFEEPASGVKVTLPVHLIARVSDDSGSLVAELDYSDGTKVSSTLPVLADPTGGRFVIGSVDGTTESEARPTQSATLVLRTPDGRLVTQEPLTVLGAKDRGTVVVRLYFVQGTALRSELRRIPRTAQVGTAAIEELLWGPTSSSDLTNGIPTPADVVGYAGRGADWGPRVRLLNVTLANGVATVNFSKELAAYGGGADRIRMIQAQVTQTLEQFATIKSVRIAIEGQTQGVLQP